MKKLFAIILVFCSCSKSGPDQPCYICQVKIGADLIRTENRCTPQLPQVQIGDTTIICKLKK